MMITFRRKSHLLALARGGARLTDTMIYHDTIARASKNLLHRAEEVRVADYLLWAVQRLYSAGEDRFYNAVSKQISLVHDIDDRRSRSYGVFYTSRNPLRLDTLLPLATG